MSETTSEVTATAGEQTVQVEEAAKEFQAITSQEEFDNAIKARIARERAKIPADYDELKAKAAKFAEWEESQKTEAQKQQEALAEAQAKLAELTVAKTRAEVAAAKGVPVELLSGGTQEELEAVADALIKFKGEQTNRLHVPGEGNSPSRQITNEQEFVGELFRREG